MNAMRAWAGEGDRVSPADLTQFVVGPGVARQVGVVLVLDGGTGFDVARAARLLGERMRAVPRMRQRLYRPPRGCGRPYWADDPDFELSDHVRQVRCPPPGDERVLLDVAAIELAKPLSSSRPLWSASFVTGLADGGVGLVVVVNHVLTDGVAGLAALAAVMDPPSETGERDNGETLPAPRFAPAARAAPRGLRQRVAELGGARPPARLARTSLNRPTGPRRRLDVVTTDLAAVREFAHARGATVNDVLLAVVAGALREMLASRGEGMRQLSVSVVVSARTAADGGDLGNKVGLMFVTVPADGDLGVRVGRIAAMTRERKSSAAGAPAALFVHGFALLARVGLVRWFVNHQRRIHTFVTNMRGPREPAAFAGARVRAMIAIPATTGNVTVTFAALSYAGTLRITVLSDPSRVPDAPVLTEALRRGLDGIS